MASNHMTGEISYFFEINENIKGKVKFGDGSYVDINGKGLIIFEAKTGEQKMITGIYYIPELKVTSSVWVKQLNRAVMSE